MAPQYAILSGIELFISPVAIEVINCLFDHCHHKYEGKRRDISEEKTDFEKRKELTYGDDKEEHVEKELELVVEHLENEGETVVLLIVESVGDKVAGFCRPFYAKLATFLRNRQVTVTFAGVAAAV